MKYQKPATSVRRDPRGAWKAESSVELGQKLRLNFLTMKRSNGSLSTTASVCKIEGMFESHRVYEDYHANLGAYSAVRVTEKAVRQQHDDLVAQNFDAVIAAVKAKYPVLAQEEEAVPA